MITPENKVIYMLIGWSTFSVRPSITQPGKYILVESWMGF